MSLRSIDTRPQVQPDLVRCLEGMLERAKTGELQAIIAAAVMAEPGDHSCTSVFRAGHAAMGPAIVALERAKLRLLGFIEDCDMGWNQAGF